MSTDRVFSLQLSVSLFLYFYISHSSLFFCQPSIPYLPTLWNWDQTVCAFNSFALLLPFCFFFLYCFSFFSHPQWFRRPVCPPALGPPAWDPTGGALDADAWVCPVCLDRAPARRPSPSSLPAVKHLLRVIKIKMLKIKLDCWLKIR